MSRNRRYFLYVFQPALATSVLLLSLGAVAAWYVHRLNHASAELLHTSLQSAQTSEQLVLSVRDVRLRLHRFLETGDSAYLQDAADRRQQTGGLIRQIADAARNSEARALIEALLAEHERLFDQLDQVGVALGKPPDEQTAGHIRSLIQLITDGVLARAEQLHTLSREAVAEHNNRNLALSGVLAWGLLALGVCGAAGGLLAGFAVARHVVRRVEQSEREASRAEQLAAVGQLSSGLAHELRNPLMTMEVLVQTATEQGSEGRLEGRDLEVLEDEISRLKNLVQSFLDFARMPNPDATPFDFGRLLAQTVQLINSAARRQNVEIILPETEGPLTVEADPVQVRQVVLNLLLNAIDSQPQGGRILLHAAVESDGEALRLPRTNGRVPDVLVFQVTDHGSGISEEVRERIFEPFVSSKETGMGLGLSICKRIVEAHHGEIRAENLAGGARFTICLPVQPIQAEGESGGHSEGESEMSSHEECQ